MLFNFFEEGQLMPAVSESINQTWLEHRLERSDFLVLATYSYAKLFLHAVCKGDLDTSVRRSHQGVLEVRTFKHLPIYLRRLGVIYDPRCSYLAYVTAAETG